MVDINKLQKAAQKFADDWKDASYERGETQTFYNDLFVIFGKDRRDYARYEKRARRINKNDGFIDLLWPGVLLVEQKSRGKDLGEAYVQADEYFEGLEENERPRYILTCDFQKWELHDLDENKNYAFELKDLPKHIHLFNFMQKGEYMPPPADPVSIKASEKMAKLYDALKKGGYDKKNMEYLLTRLTFCMFADYVGIFKPGNFRRYLNTGMQAGAVEVGGKLVELFDVLDTPEDERQAASREDLAAFRYINGGLFNETIQAPGIQHVFQGITHGSRRRGLVQGVACHIRRAVPEHHGRRRAPQFRLTLHAGGKHNESHTATIPGRVGGRIQVNTGQAKQQARA